MRYLTVPAFCAVLLTGCVAPPPMPDPTIPLYGTWGGVGIELDLSTTGGSLRYDCASGTITEALKPNANGRFNARGTYTSKTGIVPLLPDSAEHPPVPETVTYSGQLWGNSLSLNIRNAQGKNYGDFYLEYGKPADLRFCL